MANSEKQQSTNGGQIDDVDRADQISDGGDSIDVSTEGGAETSETASQSITRRLTEILVAEGDVDLLLQRSDREGGFLQWIRALDMQVMGACRADERLKPLLKLNVSAGVAEDGLLAHLSQHFEPSEVGLLARCLCVPLVSIRVGKINKQGTIMSPTSIRGNLCLTLLPTSDLRLSFNGDDGFVERLATISTEVQCTEVEIEKITADKTGRSFLLKTSDSVVSYFWCSEKSKLLGEELLGKIKDLLTRKPSLAELTGISESRLNYFASRLRAYLTDTAISSAQASGILSANSADDSSDPSELRSSQSSFNFTRSSRFRQYGSQGSKTNLIYLGSLSPRSSSFKEGLQKSLSSIRSAAREKLRRRGENYIPCVVTHSLASLNSTDPSSSTCFQKDKFPEVRDSHTFAALNFLDVFGEPSDLPISGPEIQIPSSAPSPFSPQYCWCPPVASALQYTIGNPQLPISSTEPFSLPPLSSLLSSAGPSSLLTPKPLLNVPDLPPLDFPSLLPEPVVRLPTSQQIPTFTPLICDPIVHIPVIDVCSSGQGYLVSASPSMSTSIPPLVGPLLPNGESAVEKGARETLRMLINSSNQPSGEQDVFAAGSRGFYSGARDVVAITNSMSTVGLVLLSEKSMGGGIGKRCVGRDDLIDQKEKPSSFGPSSFDEGVD